MPARDRSRDLRVTLGGSGYHYLGNPKTQFYYVQEGKTEECHDFVGNFAGANSFDLRSNDRTFPYFHGSWSPSGTLLIKLDNLPAYSMNPEAPDPLTQWGAVSGSQLDTWGAELLADTNPNKPDVSLPTFFGEMKDLPSLVRDWGGDLLKKVAKGYLSWRWAIRPMMSDVRKLLTFQDSVERRFEELRRLRDGEGIRKRKTLDSGHVETSWTSPFVINSNYITVYAKSRLIHHKRVWGSVCYKVAPDFVLPESNDELRRLAKRLTYGITSHELLSTAWELLPWSWLIDWFSTIGDTITALNNTVPLVRSRSCVMRTISSEKLFEITNLPNASFSFTGRPWGKRIRKERYVINPILPFSLSLPLLDSGKWSVLASLAALRRK